MSVSQPCKAADIKAAALANPAPKVTYYEVTLNSRKDLFGFTFKPGIKHVVDKTTLDALGDAVTEKKQIKG